MNRRTPPTKAAYASMADAAHDQNDYALAARYEAILRRLTWVPRPEQPNPMYRPRRIAHV